VKDQHDRQPEQHTKEPNDEKNPQGAE